MSAVVTITYSFDSLANDPREQGRDEARRRLAGHRGYSTTMSAEEIAALLRYDQQVDSGRSGASIDDPDG